MSNEPRFGSVIHDFRERLEFSQRLSDEGDWTAFYRRLWPDLLLTARVDKDSKWQRWGVDRQVLLPGGRQVLIDEKHREKDWGDILIEEWSVFYGDGSARNKIGWSLDPDKRCDFVVYAIPSACRAYLLPFELLRQACLSELNRWKEVPGAYPKDSQNAGYLTRNVAVSWPNLRDALCRQMLRRFGSPAAAPLPAPRIEGDQMIFDWTAVLEARP